MNSFKLTNEIINKIQILVKEKRSKELAEYLHTLHYADIAEITSELSFDDATFVVKLLTPEKASETLTELDQDVLEHVLENLSDKEIAEDLLRLDTDDAADLIADLSEKRQSEILSHINDVEHARDIVDLLRYDEDSAGGLMAKELVKVNENWSVDNCMKQMREQAQYVTRVHSIYVVDDDEKLKGRLSLKDLLTAPSHSHIKDIYIPKVDYVYVDDTSEEVARVMSKYDLEAIPVVDMTKRLVGRITIDDIVDVIKEEAEKDYQMAAGITQDVEADDSIWVLTKARLPWLLLALVGSFIAVNVSQSFSEAMNKYPALFFFTPLVAAMAGNVGVQSSAIIVQGLANDTITGSIWRRLAKEMLLAMLNSTILAIVLLFSTHFIMNTNYLFSTTIVTALVTVMIFASLIGTSIPIILNKYGIDPAIATGPFITTSNDILGLLIYFSIAKIILGF